MILRVENITIHYKKVAAVRNVSFEVMEGKLVTLIGANGAGKSTTLKAISGLKKPSSGEIFFKNQRIDGMPTQDIVRLGISQVPEGRKLFPDMNVIDNLEMGAFLQKSKKRIRGDLDKVFDYFPRLKERQRQRAGSLSGGEQQMLAIGRALMSKPELLILDEPSVGLAPIMNEQIAKIISAINNVGVSILIVEQNASLALRIAHKGYVLETGSIVLEGSTQDLLENDAVKKAYLGG